MRADSARILLDARASIDQPDVWGYTPLSAAAEEGNLEVVKILCRKRANVSLDSQQDPVSATFFLLDKNPIEFTNSGDLEAFASMDDV